MPTLWIGNVVGQLDPAFLRRFDFVMQVREPSMSVRRHMIAQRAPQLGLDEGAVERLAARERVPPALLESASRLTAWSQPSGSDEAERIFSQVIEGNLRAQRHHHRGRGYRLATKTYDLSYLNTNSDLEALTRGLELTHGSVCLYGPPGCGKTAYAHYLARRLDVPAIAKRASDLLSCWVGNTEKAIAEMFEQARDEGALLLLDEADSLLRDRREAKHSWEVTQVNELLVQMECFDGVFVCSTNLMNDLDQASLRRFDLKVRFDFLDREQRVRLFDAILVELADADTASGHDHQVTAAELRALSCMKNLTPGDFAAVARRLRILGTEPTTKALLAGLREEVNLKEGTRPGVVGFCVDRDQPRR